MTQDEADRTIEAMFKWTYDSPIPYPIDQQRLKCSAIANIVIDSQSTEMSIAYARAKLVRGIDRAFWNVPEPPPVRVENWGGKTVRITESGPSPKPRPSTKVLSVSYNPKTECWTVTRPTSWGHSTRWCYYHRPNVLSAIDRWDGRVKIRVKR